MLEARIQHHFFETADLLYQVAESLSRPVAEAAQAAVGCLTAGGKLLACGQGADADLAAVLCGALTLRFERERPPLAALALGPGLGRPLALPPAPGHGEDAFAAQLRALGHPGDLLVVFAGLYSDDPALRAVVQAAHQQEMSVVLFTGGDPGAWPDLLAETDVWVPVATARPARVRELHLMATHALCDAIDMQLLGEESPA
jgi:D-sedoheptulose 7-phosphate isomerase